MGRPKNENAKRSILTMRITEELRDKLTALAAANNRSMSKEVESRLEESLRPALGTDRQSEAFLGVVRATIADVEARADASWLTDLEVWSFVKQALNRELDKRAPVPGALAVTYVYETLQQELRTGIDLFELLQSTEEQSCGQVSRHGLSRLPSQTTDQHISYVQRFTLQVERIRDARSELDTVIEKFDAELRARGVLAKSDLGNDHDD